MRQGGIKVVHTSTMSRGCNELGRVTYLMLGRAELTSTKLMNAYPTLLQMASLSVMRVLSKRPGLHLLAVIGKINPQIHEVILAPTGFVNDSLEHGLVDLIRNISEHDLGNQSGPMQRRNWFKDLLLCARLSPP